MGKLYKTIFFSMFGIIAFSLFIAAYHVVNGDTKTWQMFAMIPLTLYLLHSWFLMLMLCYNDFFKKKYAKYKGEKISVIVPCYNEEPRLLEQAIESIVNAKGNKEILLVDDGSTNNIRGVMEALERKYPEVRLIAYDINRGKRIALWHAVKGLHKESKFIVCLDSDTLIDKDALVKIVEPFSDPKIGATTGNILLLNEKKSWLTKLTAAYYWTGLNVYKQAQSVFGGVACCSGCLSAYRSEAAKKIIDEFINERFFGELCTHSEDRHLTNLTLKAGYNVVYVPEAISYTQSPETVGGFIRQQKRWKRGFLRESVYALTFTWKTHPMLFLWILLWDMGLPFIIFGTKLVLIAMIFVDPMMFLTTIVPAWILWTCIRYMIVLFRSPNKMFGTIAFTFFSELGLYWITFYSLLTIKNRSWVTR